MNNFATDFEAFDTDFEEMQELMNECSREAAEEEAALELEQIADDLSVNHAEAEEELIEALRLCAAVNPLSEAAIDLKEQAFPFFL